MSGWITVTLAGTDSRTAIAVGEIVAIYDYTESMRKMDTRFREAECRSLIVVRGIGESTFGVVDAYDDILRQVGAQP